MIFFLILYRLFFFLFKMLIFILDFLYMQPCIFFLFNKFYV
jgi:hypothetical protein